MPDKMPDEKAASPFAKATADQKAAKGERNAAFRAVGHEILHPLITKSMVVCRRWLPSQVLEIS